MQLKEVWCEWDIGQSGLVFKDGHAAERWLRSNPALHQMSHEMGAADFDTFYQEIVDECLIGIEDVELIE